MSLSGDMERVTPPLLLLLLSVMLGILADSTLQEQTVRALTSDARRPLIAYLVMRAEDCEGHLELLRQLERPGIARATDRGGAVVIGSPRAAAPALALLARELPGVRARRASWGQLRLLRRLGYRRTPVLLVLDAATGSVRFAAEAPRTPGERLRFLSALGAAAAI